MFAADIPPEFANKPEYADEYKAQLEEKAGVLERKAEQAYRKAIEVQPQYFKNYRELASFYFKQGNGAYPGMGARLDGEVIQEMPAVRVPLSLFS